VLHHVGQFVCEQPVAGLGAGRVLIGAEIDVRSDRERMGGQLLGRARRVTAGVDHHV
jgi:hypothetical protein